MGAASVAWAYLTFVSALLATATFASAGSAEDSELLERIRQELKIPQAYEAKLGPAEKTDIPGLVKRTLDVSTGSKSHTETLFLSEDGHYLFRGRLYDLRTEPGSNQLKRIPVEGHPTLGPADAKVTIIEYGDFQCPFCERTYWMVKYKLLPRYADQVRLVYKDFPLTQIHPWAMQAAVAAQCAFEQDNEAFWKMHDLIFESQDELNPDNIKMKLVEFASITGLDLAAFQACYDTEATLPRVKASLTEAESLGLTGTPAFVVNGQVLPGALPFSAFKSIIDRELAPEKTYAGDSRP